MLSTKFPCGILGLGKGTKSHWSINYLINPLSQRINNNTPHPPEVLLVPHLLCTLVNDTDHRLTESQGRGGPRQDITHQSFQNHKEPAEGNSTGKRFCFSSWNQRKKQDVWYFLKDAQYPQGSTYLSSVTQHSKRLLWKGSWIRNKAGVPLEEKFKRFKQHWLHEIAASLTQVSINSI